jgi:hypothetical protein
VSKLELECHEVSTTSRFYERAVKKKVSLEPPSGAWQLASPCPKSPHLALAHSLSSGFCFSLFAWLQ